MSENPEPQALASSAATTRLFRKSRSTPASSLLLRLSILVGVLLLLVLVLWLDREGLHDQLDGHVSFSDVLYFTAVSVTTVGYGDIVPVTDRARLIDAAFVTPIRLVVWLLFLGTAYELIIQKWIEAWRMKKLQDNLADHVIICGFGHTGESAARELAGRGRQIVVMDLDPAAMKRAADAGYIGLLGNPTLESDLNDAAVARASAVLVCVGRDDTCVLATLTIRNMNPHVRIVCNAREGENLKLLRQAGADSTVLPSQVGGYLMADSVRSPHINDYVIDMLTSNGRVRLFERPCEADEVGKRMRDIEPDLVVRIYRDGAPIGFWESDNGVVREEDVLLVLVPVDKGAT